ncbi:hypothetical protein [Shewanella xiamenensis]|uniref:hypothetical protein n=1 Tax=Shewanella xiamenensis TaxID=332186 RepID=UPI0021C09D24|nr:hypothetical protein [Shewanella xiamenensis]MCT8875896.1 hypothetical protein [Shewanella xiamenensis]
MNLKKRLATVLWLGLALAASVMAGPPSPAQDHVGGGVTSLVTGEAQEDGDVSAAQVISDAESQCGSAGAAHWALYQRLSDRSALASLPRPDFSGDWLLNTKASDDPREKAKEAAQASRQARGGGPGGMGRGGGRQDRGGGMGGSGGLSSGELSAQLAPAQELHVIHQDPMLLIADESDRRQRLYTDFRGASVSASGGLQQRVAIAGWEGAVLVVETTTLGKKFVQSYQIDGRNGQLIISSVAQVSEGQPVSYRLVYDRLKPDLGEKQARRNVSAGQGGTR